jgi:transcriptional regulator with XRE-family HTH domain
VLQDAPSADRDIAAPNRLRALREARGLSLRQVARDAGIDPGTLSKVERGRRGLSLLSALSLAHVLGVWTDELGLG